MTTKNLRLALMGSCVLSLPLAAYGQNTERPGYAIEALTPAPFGSVIEPLSSGGFLAFDGLAITEHDATGAQVSTLVTLPSSVFPSFVRVDPTESFALVGESSTGTVSRLELSTGTMTAEFVANFNWDLVFDVDPDLVWVSAALGGFGAGNDILQYRLSTGTLTARAHVPGPSGPLAMGASGDLYYGTQFDGWPAPGDTENLIRWDAAELAGNTLLTELDADVVLAQLDGTSSVEVDETGNALYVIDSDPNQATENVVLRFDLAGNLLDEVVAGTAYLSSLDLRESGGVAVFAPYQPSGATLTVFATDYNLSFSERIEVGPARPVVTFSGPGTAVQGPATLSISGAPSGGSLVWMWTRTQYLSNPEWSGDLGWGVPTFFMADPAFLLRESVPLPLDAQGQATLSYTQPANWYGQAVFQARLLDAAGNLVGTSSYVVND